MDGTIVLEEHFSLPETLGEAAQSAVFGASWQEIRRRLLDLHGERLSHMDKHGVELMIVSLTAPAIQAIPKKEQAVETARKANDALAEAVAKRPDRLAGFAALPLQDPDAAIAELNRCVTELGFPGASVNGFSQVGSPDTVAYYDDPIYLPFWEAVQTLDVPFYLHPRDPLPGREPIYDGHPWLRGSSWAFGAETAIHMLRLMCSGLFDRYPRLKIVLGHLGEGLPASIWRLDHRLEKTPRNIPARRKMADYLRSNVYLTTSGNFRTPTLVDAMVEIGSDRILFSIDYPYEEIVEGVEWLRDASISPSDRVKIGRTNAIDLFKLGLPRTPGSGKRP